ncbi:ATP/GTP-binding site motif A [Hyphomicrobiales bacterium]|nr:ATP/GTP-binding site motif A [Hyphomicrobiales bacterium]CAH1665872.1 ATP/GTP-binding site motif A [Hyphomicrobiales bacterium]
MARKPVVFTAMAVTLLWTSGAMAEAVPGVSLAPHRAVYDLSLADGSNAIQSAMGRVVYEITGTACDGYASRSRQVVVLEGESSASTTDMRMTTFEDASGGSFRFKAETRNANTPPKLVDGEAVRRDGAVAVNFVKPVRETLKLGDAMFPAAHLKTLIAGAKAGKPIVEARVFDGSEDGRSFYDTLAVIGRADAVTPGETARTGKFEPGKSDAGKAAPGESDLAKGDVGGSDDEAFAERQRRFDGLFGTGAHWPIAISYFKQATARSEALPVYVLSFDLYENGIARSLTLKYDNFTLKGELKELELLKAAACE